MQKYVFGFIFFIFLFAGCVSNKDMAQVKEITKQNSNNISKQDSLFHKNIEEQKNISQANKKYDQLLLNKINNMEIKFDSLSLQVNKLQEIQIDLKNQIYHLKKEKVANKKSKSEILYNNGMGVYRKKNYSKALSLFREFLLKYPKNKYSPNAQYWIGECYYSQNKFEKSKDEFQNVLDYYPKSSKAPDAQVKIGIIYFKQNKKEQSLLELNRVLKMYPDYERREMVKSLIKEYQ